MSFSDNKKSLTDEPKKIIDFIFNLSTAEFFIEKCMSDMKFIRHAYQEEISTHNDVPVPGSLVIQLVSVMHAITIYVSWADFLKLCNYEHLNCWVAGNVLPINYTHSIINVIISMLN